MGNVTSGPLADGLQALAHISGAHPVPLADPVWALLVTHSDPVLAQSDPRAVEKEIRPHTASLVYNNAQTLNCQRLIYAVAQALGKAQARGAAAAANAARVARAILKDLLEQLNPEQLHTFIELPEVALGAAGTGDALRAEFPDVAAPGSLVALLCRAALGALSGKPDMTAAEFLLQHEAVALLMTLASSQLYTPHARASPGAHPFLEALMQQPDLAPGAVQALLLLFLHNQAPPAALRLYQPPESRSVLRIVRSAAASVFWLPYTAYTMLLRRGGAAADGAAGPLGRAAVQLLLALHFHPPLPDSPGGNPFRQALRRLQDADEALPEAAAEGGRGGGGAGAGAVAVVPYAALYAALGRSLGGSEASVLLLYALLHGTPHFHEYCMARSDLDTLLLPLLELLYGAPDRGANQLYMLLIILLILSQEPSFAGNVHRVALPSVPFYRERLLAGTTLGSLLVVLLLRTAHQNLAAGKDVYTHTNTLAALANLAPHMAGLSAHAAQRLVSLFHLLARRHARLEAAQLAAAGAAAGSADPGAEQRALELQLYADFLRIVLEIVNAVLAQALPANPELVYALLHRQEVFAPFRAHPRYAELMENVATVTEHFGRRVDEALGGLPAGAVSAGRVLDVIRLHSRGWRRDRLRAVPELRFSYEEEASPEEFFVPYVWSLAVAEPSIPWTLSAIALFSPSLARAGAGGEEGALSPRLTPRLPTDEAPEVAANV